MQYFGAGTLTSIADGFTLAAEKTGGFVAALAPVLPALLAITAVIGTVAIAYDVLVETFDEAAEKAQKSAQEYEATKSKIESLNSELEDTNAKIDELQAKGSLTLVEQADLESLREHKELLESEIAVQEKLAELQGKQAAADAKNVLTNKGFGVYDDGSSYKRSFWQELLHNDAEHEYVDIIELTTRKQQALNDEQDRYNQLVKDGADAAIIEGSANKIATLQGEISDYWGQIVDYQDTITDPTTLARIEELNDLILGEAGEIAKRQQEIDSFLSKPTLSKYVDEAKSYAEAMNGITVDELTRKFPALANAAKNADIDLNELVNTLNSMAGTLNFDEVRNQLRNAFNGADMHEFYGWQEWINGLSESELTILYGIYQSKDTSAWGFDDWKEALNGAKEEAEDFETTIDSVLSKPTLQRSVDLVKELATEMGGITADTIISQFPELASAAEAAGFTVQDVADAINNAINGIDFSKAKEELRDAFNFTPNGSAGDFRMLESWDAWISSLNNEQIKILYGIYQSTDTSAWSFEDWKTALINAENDANAATDKIAADVDKITSSISKAQSLLSTQSAGKSISLADFNSDELKDYTAALENNNGTLQLNAEKVRAIVQAKADEESAIIATNKALAQSEYLENASQIEQLRQKIIDKNFAEGESVDSINAEIDALLASNGILKNQCDQYDIMSQSLREATDAYHNWLNAQNASDYGDMFDDSMNAFQRIMDTYNSDSDIFGQFGSKKFDAAVEFWIPDTVSTDNIDSIKSYMDSVSSYLTFDDNGKADGLNIEKFCEAAVSNGLMVLDEATDEYKIAGQMTMEQFAEGMNLSLPVVQAFFDQMQLYGGEFSWADEVNKTIGDLAVSATEAAESLRTKLHDLGYEDYEINIDVSDIDTTEGKIAALDQTIEEMQTLKGYVSIDSEEAQQANEIIAYCIRQQQMLSEPVVMSVDTSAVSTNMGEAISKIQEFQTLANQIEVQKAIGLDTTSAETQLDTLCNDISGLDPNILATLNLDTSSIDGLESSISEITPEMLVELGINDEAIIGYEAPEKESTVVFVKDSTEPDEYVPPDKQATVTFTKQSWSVDSYNPANLTRTVTYYVRTVGKVGVNGTAHVGGTANAGGNWGTAQGGMTLVGELGREIIVDPFTGQWYTVGDTGAEFTYIPRGAIVFNHQQTEDLLEHGYVAGRASALAGGTAMVTGGIKRQYASYTNGGTYKSNSSSGSSSSSSSSNWSNTASNIQAVANASADLEKNLEETLKTMKEEFDEIIGNFEHSIFLLEKNGADAQQIVNTYIAMQKSVHEQADKYRAMGLDENSDYIQELQKQWWQYNDSIQETIVDSFEQVKSEQENAIKLIENWKDNAIHKGDMKAVEKYADDIVQYYKDAQDTIHAEAEYYRSLGYSDTSDEVSELSDLWWEYRDNIIKAITDAYEAANNERQNFLTLNENWLNNAINNNDRGKVARYTANTVEYYRQMQDELHREADYYRSMGYSDTSDEVSKLSDLWWDYEQNIKDALMSGFDTLLDNANNAVDEIQNVYDTLKTAAQEYAESGFITVDTFQEIIALGPQYLAMLQDENGMLVINEENIQKIIAARTQQLAIEQALNYVEQLRIALADNDVASLNRLLFATDAAAKSTWDLVYAQLNLLDLSSEQYQQAVNNINALRSLSESAISGIGQETGQLKKELEEANKAAQEALKEQQSALDDLLKYVEAMIKQEVKNQVDLLKKQKTAYKEIVDLQKKSLDLEKEKNNYNKTVTDKLSDISKLQQRIQMLDLDTSREAQNEKMKLQDELYKLQEDLSETQADRSIDLTKDALDAQEEAYSKSKDAEIETMENTISSEEKVYQLAIDRISNHWDTLYQDLLSWNYEYGSVTQEELINAWNNASVAVQQYGGYLQAVAGIQAELNRLQAEAETIASMGSSATTVGKTQTYDTSGENYIKQMKANSAAWHNADEAERVRLANENVDLAKKVEQVTGLKLVRGNDGVWYVDHVGGAKLYEMYHSGTPSVGDEPTPEQNEVFAILEKGEMVLTKNHQKQLYRFIDDGETMLGRYGALFGALSSDSLNAIMQEQVKRNSQGINNVSENYRNAEINVPVQIYTVQKLDESELNRLVKLIGNKTTDTIREGFTKNGIRNISYRT